MDFKPIIDTAVDSARFRIDDCIDFEDYLEEWNRVEETMPGYLLYGFNYGNSNYYDSDKIKWKHMKIRKFSNR